MVKESNITMAPTVSRQKRLTKRSQTKKTTDKKKEKERQLTCFVFELCN